MAAVERIFGNTAANAVAVVMNFPPPLVAGILSRPPWSSRFAPLLHSVLRPSPSRGAPGSSLGGLVRGWACFHGPAREVRLDNRVRTPGQGA